MSSIGSSTRTLRRTPTYSSRAIGSALNQVGVTNPVYGEVGSTLVDVSLSFGTQLGTTAMKKAAAVAAQNETYALRAVGPTPAWPMVPKANVAPGAPPTF